MKQFSLSVAGAFVGGLLLIAGFLLANWALEGGKAGQEERRESRQDPRQSVRVIQHARVEGTQRFTVQGVAQNVSSEEWGVVELRVTLRVGGAKVNECEGMIFDEFAPGARQSFQVVCKDADGAGLPPGMTYDLSVSSVM